MALPTITTQSVGNIQPFTLQARLNISNNGGSLVSRIGFVFSLSSQSLPGNIKPELTDYEFIADEKGSFLNGNFEIYLTSLTKNTRYYIRAFCKNKEGYSYGAEIYETTLADFYPAIYYPPRTRENKDGVNYNPNDPKKLFSTDLENYDNEIYNIEHELGLSPKGSDANVKARFDRIEGELAWKLIKSGSFTYAPYISGLSGDTDDTYKLFMRVQRESLTQIKFLINNSSSSMYSYHRIARGYYSGAVLNSHGYSQNSTALNISRDNLKYFTLELTIYARRNGMISMHGILHGYDDVDNYELIHFDGIYRNVYQELFGIYFQPSGTLDYGYYRLYKLV